MNEENVENSNTQTSEFGNVEQIREILFGSQSRELKEKFETIENTIETMNREIVQKIEQNQHEFNDRLATEVETLTRKIKNIASQQQQEFSDIRDISLKTENRLQSSLDILEEEFSAKNDQLQKQQTQYNNDLRTQMHDLKKDLVAVVNDKIAEIGSEKLSRDDAANIMMEAAMGMKGMSIEKQLSLAKLDN